MNRYKPTVQKRRRILQVSFVMVLLAAILVVTVYHQTLFSGIKTALLTAGGSEVESIEVAGLVYTEAEALKTALDITAGDPLVGYDVAAARTRLEKLTWVKTASVEKKLPHKLIVQVYEFQPVARIEEDGRWFVVNKDAVRIMQDAENQFVSLPALSGVGAAEAAADLLAQLQDRPNFTAQLKTANYVGERRWDFTFKSGVLIRFPPENMSNAFTILDKLETERHVLTLKGGVVDLRLPNKITLKIPPETEKTPVL